MIRAVEWVWFMCETVLNVVGGLIGCNNVINRGLHFRVPIGVEGSLRQ